MQRWDTALDNLKEIIERRDEDYAVIIRSLVANQKVTGKLCKTYPEVFGEEDVARRVERAVLTPFELFPCTDEMGDDVAPRLDVLPR